jgi:aminoglycoside 3-N-acetyltransferase
MRQHAYNLVRRTLSQEQRNRLKQGVRRARARLAPVLRARHGSFSARELREELAPRIPPDTEIVMVHCSLNDLVPMYTEGPRELLDALLELCGTERTLAMPAFFFGDPDQDTVAYYRRTPVFDARRTPSQMGLLSELFRRRPGVRRSLHPTASVSALGPLADELVSGHHLAETTFGPGTPFAVMAERRTAVMGLGTEYFRSLSQVHAAEDLLGDRYPLTLRPGTVPVDLVAADGAVHRYQLQVAETPFRRRLERLELLLGPEELVRWRFHGVPIFVTSAARVTEALSAAALAGETIYDAMPIRSRKVPVPSG